LVLEAADLHEAIAWGQKAIVACGAPVEVRPIFYARLRDKDPAEAIERRSSERN